jgi:hypothetical protein
MHIAVTMETYVAGKSDENESAALLGVDQLAVKNIHDKTLSSIS